MEPAYYAIAMKITLAANECVDHNQQEREVRHRKESTPMDHSDLVLLQQCALIIVDAWSG
jgi:hypothetical protein